MPDWWTPAQLAAHYQVSRRSIYREIESGRMPAIKIGALRVSDMDRIRWEQAAIVRPAKPETPDFAEPRPSPFTSADDLRDAIRFGLV